MLFTLFVAALVATLWALGSFLLYGGATHDPTSLELAIMAGITLGTYAWMQRLRKIREQETAFQLSDQLQSTFAAALTAEETAADSPSPTATTQPSSNFSTKPLRHSQPTTSPSRLVFADIPRSHPPRGNA